MSEIDYKKKLLGSFAFELALDDTGVYCKSIKRADGVVEERTEWQDGWNACHSNILDRASIIETYLKALPEEIKDFIINGVLQVAIRESEPSLWINCNDLFYWACADGEDFQLTDLEELNKSYQDSPKFGDILWVCRKRKMRPQQPYYKYLKEDKKLFDACGPKRKE